MTDALPPRVLASPPDRRPARAAGRRAATLLKNGLLAAISFLLCLLFAEGAMRVIDDLPLFAFVLPERIGAPGVDTTDRYLDGIPRADGVARALFRSDPPTLPNKTRPSDEWMALRRELRTKPAFAAVAASNPFQPWDMFKAWNAALVGDPCKHPYLGGAPGKLFVYDPPDGKPRPIFRFIPNATTPFGLTTNDFGWRGRPVPFKRAPDTIRIVFVGASTTVEPHHYPWSGPELIENWLNRWAAEQGLKLRFEVLNAARESVISTDNAAIVRQEVAPLHPDLVFYYEGGNQLNIGLMLKQPPGGTAQPAGRLARWLRELAPYSALVRRAEALVGGSEWPKPDYALDWPLGLDELDPDIGRKDLPVNLNLIMNDLESMRADLAAVGSDLAIGSFHWLAKDGLKLDSVGHKPLLQNLNVGYWPFRYRDLERMTKFENRVFEKYAAAHGLPFIDVARYMPSDPDLFADAMHNTAAGVRLRAWIVFQQLVPVIQAKIASGAWPRAVTGMGDNHPAFAKPPHQITFDCRKPS